MNPNFENSGLSRAIWLFILREGRTTLLELIAHCAPLYPAMSRKRLQQTVSKMEGWSQIRKWGRLRGATYGVTAECRRPKQVTQADYDEAVATPQPHYSVEDAREYLRKSRTILP